MMEKFLDDAEKWERRHTDSWLGRHGGTFGAATSAQADLISPMGFIDFTNDPSTFNLAKAVYSPGVAMGGYSLASMISGQKIMMAERIMHSTDMARRTAIAAGRTAGRAALFTIRRTPGAIAAAAIVGTGLFLQDLYHDLSGMYIGDIRFNR